MTSPPISECQDIDALVSTEHAVHMILKVSGDWDSDRDATVAELERRIKAATAYAESPAWKTRFATRIGVVRVQSPTPAPSIVAHLLNEQGIELEDLSIKGPDDGPTCGYCGREKLPHEQAAMTDSGWACPSCLRAWNVKAQPELAKKPRQLRIPPRFIWPIVIAVMVLFAVGLFYELGHLNKMNRVIRMHVPQ